MKFIDFSNLRGDFYGGLTAGIVALPLALAFGEASGVGPMAGLWGAIILGFFAALFGGTGSQISGPTGPMVVVFAGIVGSVSGNYSLIFGVVVLAGLLQIFMGVFKLGKYINLVPHPVVSGFMSGIGCIIISLQISRFFGYEPAANGTIPALYTIPRAIASPVLPALLVGVIALLIVCLWPKAWARCLPSSIVALIAGTAVSFLLPGAPLLGDVPTGLPRFYFPVQSLELVSVAMLEAVLILAFLASIDSLLTSLVADNLTHTRHNSNRELIGQGIGNTIAGLFGAVPGAGATMRTLVNISNGGRTKLSGIFHSLILLAIVLAFGPMAEKIPHAVLASILIKVGYDIVDKYFLRRLHQSPRWDLFIMLLVLVLTVFVNLITAVVVGALLSAVVYVKKVADYQLDQFASNHGNVTDPMVKKLLEAAGPRVMLLEFGSPFSFAAAADFEQMMRERMMRGTDFVIIDFSNSTQIDLSTTRAVETLIIAAKKLGKTVYLTGMNPKINKVINAFCRQPFIDQCIFFDSPVEALSAINLSLDRKTATGGQPETIDLV